MSGYAFGEPATVVKPGRKVDPYSGEAEALSWDEADVTRVPLAPCAWWGVTSDASPTGTINAPVPDAITVSCPDPSADVDPVDRLEILGHVWEISGLPLALRNPWTGWTPGVDIACKRLGARNGS